jgi:hypothetical protein
MLLSPFEQGEATLTLDYLVVLLAHGMKGGGGQFQIPPL